MYFYECVYAAFEARMYVGTYASKYICMYVYVNACINVFIQCLYVCTYLAYICVLIHVPVSENLTTHCNVTVSFHVALFTWPAYDACIMSFAMIIHIGLY